MALSLLLRSVAYAIVAGLGLASACWASGEWAFGNFTNTTNMARERTRSASLDDRLSALRQRRERKAQAVEGLLAGWLTFDEATNEFRQALPSPDMFSDTPTTSYTASYETPSPVSVEPAPAAPVAAGAAATADEDDAGSFCGVPSEDMVVNLRVERDDGQPDDRVHWTPTKGETPRA